MTRGVMGCDYSHTGSYFLLLTHRRCSPCLVIHTGEVLSPFSGIQDWISLSQALFAGALWLPSGCVVATPLFMESRYHTALSCLLLTPYHVLLLLAGHSMGTRQHLVVDWADCVDDEPLEGCAVPAGPKPSTLSPVFHRVFHRVVVCGRANPATLLFTHEPQAPWVALGSPELQCCSLLIRLLRSFKSSQAKRCHLLVLPAD